MPTTVDGFSPTLTGVGDRLGACSGETPQLRSFTDEAVRWTLYVDLGGSRPSFAGGEAIPAIYELLFHWNRSESARERGVSVLSVGLKMLDLEFSRANQP